jgi:hypothetical protein
VKVDTHKCFIDLAIISSIKNPIAALADNADSRFLIPITKSSYKLRHFVSVDLLYQLPYLFLLSLSKTYAFPSSLHILYDVSQTLSPESWPNSNRNFLLPLKGGQGDKEEKHSEGT